MRTVQAAVADYAASQRNLAMQPYRSLVEDMLIRRHALKIAKNYAEADKIRDELIQHGFSLKDSPKDVYVSVAGVPSSGWYITLDLKTLVKEASNEGH